MTHPSRERRRYGSQSTSVPRDARSDLGRLEPAEGTRFVIRPTGTVWEIYDRAGRVVVETCDTLFEARTVMKRMNKDTGK